MQFSGMPWSLAPITTAVQAKCMQFHEWPLSMTSVKAARISNGYVLTLMDEGSYVSTLIMVRHRDQHS